MDDTNSPFHQDELSPEDLEVLRTFHAIEEPAADMLQEALWPGIPPNHPQEATAGLDISSDDEMLVLFTTEGGEDIATMRLALQQLEQDERLDSPAFLALKRTAHKVAGTTAAIGCDSMSKIARHMETVIKLLEGGAIVYLTGLIALGHAAGALESTLQSIASHGYESINPLLELEEEYEVLNIEIHTGSTPEQLLPGDTASTLFHTVSQAPVNLQHLNRLEQHAEKLIELHTPLAHAQKEVETALDELHAAQARLRRLERLLSTLSVSLNAASGAMDTDAGRPPSSLVARILQEAAQRTGHLHQSKSALPAQPLLAQETALWDEMEIDRFTEANVLAHSFTEAIADVATATSQLRLAFEHLNSIVTQQVDQANIVRSNAHLLRSIPFSVLATQLQESVELIAGDQIGRVQLELSGETIEIDQDILETLTHPLLELVQSTVADGLFFAKSQEQGEERKLRAWLNAHAIGNEVTIEIGFSLPISPGAITALRETVHHLYGSISLRERARDGMALRLRFPRSQRIIQGLLVQAGGQGIVVPFSQVKRIYYHKQGSDEAYPQDAPLAGTPAAYHLNTLLGFSTGNYLADKTFRTLLIPELDDSQIVVEVDEVVGEVELVMKTLAAHLCRPGIAATAIDGSGNVLLVVNLPQIIQLQQAQQHDGSAVIETGTLNDRAPSPPQLTTNRRQKILIADDSVYIRRSISLTLSREGYDVLEAADGIQTLELLSKESPNLLLLDIEMPNINGYGVLNFIRVQQRFPELKIVMLTSRSSEKHKQRAHALGAHSYLTKPCPQDLLIETIQSLLTLGGES
jgi:chemosensory pili system protein ChpA (sensor histidine kinase/response regulator)